MLSHATHLGPSFEAFLLKLFSFFPIFPSMWPKHWVCIRWLWGPWHNYKSLLLKLSHYYLSFMDWAIILLQNVIKLTKIIHIKTVLQQLNVSSRIQVIRNFNNLTNVLSMETTLIHYLASSTVNHWSSHPSLTHLFFFFIAMDISILLCLN